MYITKGNITVILLLKFTLKLNNSDKVSIEIAYIQKNNPGKGFIKKIDNNQYYA